MLLGLASPDSKPICHSCSFDIANTFQKCLFTKPTKQSLLLFKTLAKHIWKVRRKRTTWTACLWNYSQTFAFLKFWNDFRTKLAPAELLRLSWSISSQEKSYHGTREFPIKFAPTPHPMSCVSRPLPEFGRVIRIQNAPDDFVPGTVPLRQKNAGDEVPLIFLYPVRCPWKYLIAISASNLFHGSDSTFSWLF